MRFFPDPSFLAILATPEGAAAAALAVAAAACGAKAAYETFFGPNAISFPGTYCQAGDGGSDDSSSNSTGEGQAPPPRGPTVGDVLAGKKGSIKNAPLPEGSTSLHDTRDMPINEVADKAKQNLPGFKTLLSDKRFNK